jgi:phage shock protein PspC (stress-responsive transcriptional regulator)
MNKVININFQGRILPIEEEAYEMLKQYIASLRTYFANEEGRDEIINDIECRVAELCDDQLKKGTVCITEEHINLIIASIGRPADFEAQDGFEASAGASSSTSQQQTYTAYTNEPTYNKHLYRDESNKVLGGVCSGIANYFNVDPLVVRILWILLAGVNILAYLILWIAVPSSSVKEVGGVKKRLFRDIDHKIIGGVCAGLSKYFGVKVRVVRILFVIPSIILLINWNHFHLFQFWEFADFPNFMGLTFSPGVVFVYIVLWLVLPEARTSAEKLEMVGEKVDINSIKNTIQTDMEGFGKRAQSWGNSFDKYKKSAGESTTGNNTGDASTNYKSNDESTLDQRKGCMYYFGRTVTVLMKAFVYFILGIIIISVLAALFGVGIATTGLLPLRKFILEEGAQTGYLIGAILLFIWVPVVGIVTSIIRKIAGFKNANIWIRSSFWALWILGWVMVTMFLSSLTKSFSRRNEPVEKVLSLANPSVDYLEVTASPKMKYYEQRWFNIEPFQVYDEDTVRVRNLKIRIVQSKTDSFEVKYVTMSNGKSIAEANKLAEKINFSVLQLDSLLFLDRGIAITKTDKFRNQHVIMTIAVPIGKRFKITNKGWSQTNIKVNRTGIHSETMSDFGNDTWVDEWDENWDSESFSYDRGVEYKMTATGLEKLGRADGEEENTDSNNDNPDEIQQQLQELKEERKRLENDLEKSREEKLNEKIKKIDRALEKKIEEKIEKKIDKKSISTVAVVTQAATSLGELHYVLDRFIY